jgi:hypothetical protein
MRTTESPNSALNGIDDHAISISTTDDLEMVRKNFTKSAHLTTECMEGTQIDGIMRKVPFFVSKATEMG